MAEVTAYLDRTPRECDNCGDVVVHRWGTECSNCEGYMAVCDDCLTTTVEHKECPAGT